MISSLLSCRHSDWVFAVSDYSTKQFSAIYIACMAISSQTVIIVTQHEPGLCTQLNYAYHKYVSPSLFKISEIYIGCMRFPMKSQATIRIC